MSILFILFLLILSIIFGFFKSVKTSFAILIATLISFIIIGNGILPDLLLKPLESPYTVILNPQYSDKSNAIVVLGAGVIKIPETDIVKPTVMAYARIYEELKRYQSCKKSGYSCTLIMSGGDACSIGISEALVYKNALLEFNISPLDIQIEPNSMNTYKNAELTSQYLKTQNFDRVFLVTSGIHMKRALLYFSHFGVQALPAPSDYITADISLLPVGYNFAITDFALHEYIGMLRYRAYNLFGWNTRASTPGYP